MKRVKFITLAVAIASCTVLAGLTLHKDQNRPIVYKGYTRLSVHKPQKLDAPTASDLLKLVNSERSKNGVKTLLDDPLLDRSAQLKANEMVATKSYSHIDPRNGSHGYDYIRQVGDNCRTDAENLAGDYSSSLVVKDWLNSPDHRAVMLDNKYDKVGFATVKSPYGYYYVVAHFCQSM